MRRGQLADLTAFVAHDPHVNGDWKAALWLMTGTRRSWWAQTAWLSQKQADFLRGPPS